MCLEVNPTIPIPAGSSLVHGIYDQDIANEPTFQEIASEIHQLISDSDLLDSTVISLIFLF